LKKLIITAALSETNPNSRKHLKFLRTNTSSETPAQTHAQWKGGWRKRFAVSPIKRLAVSPIKRLAVSPIKRLAVSPIKRLSVFPIRKVSWVSNKEKLNRSLMEFQ